MNKVPPHLLSHVLLAILPASLLPAQEATTSPITAPVAEEQPASATPESYLALCRTYKAKARECRGLERRLREEFKASLPGDRILSSEEIQQAHIDFLENNLDRQATVQVLRRELAALDKQVEDMILETNGLMPVASGEGAPDAASSNLSESEQAERREFKRWQRMQVQLIKARDLKDDTVE